jgi:hypothetical protein
VLEVLLILGPNPFRLLPEPFLAFVRRLLLVVAPRICLVLVSELFVVPLT